MVPSVRARTVLATSSHLELGVLDQREVVARFLIDPTGCILLRPGRDRCWERLLEGEPCPPLDLVATDVTAVPQPDRIRARVRMRGRLDVAPAPPHCDVLRHLQLLAGQPMARFAPSSVIVELPSAGDRWAAAVPLPAYAEATRDPLAGWESLWIAHLDAAHAATLRCLARQEMPLDEQDKVRALQADSGGVTVRVYRADSQHDLRFDFAAPARCGCRAVGAFKDLVRSRLSA